MIEDDIDDEADSENSLGVEVENLEGQLILDSDDRLNKIP